MWDVNFIDFLICIRYISKHPHFKCDLFLRFQIGELLHHDNIICLPGQSGGRAAISFRVLWKGVVLMSTYEELMVILTIGLLIVAILNLKNK